MGIFKRGNVFYYRRRINGRLVVKSLEVHTRAEAEAIVRNLKAKDLEHRLGLLDPSTVTLKMLRDQFLAARRGFVADTTLGRYKTALTTLINDLGAQTRLRSLTTARLATWAQDRRHTRSVNGRKDSRTPEGINSDLRHIRAALNWAVESGIIQQAPKIKMLKTPRRLPRHISPEDLERILSAETDPLMKRLWTFMVWTGLRRSEAMGLQWQDIRWGDRPSCRVIGKGDRERTIPLLPPAIAALGPGQDIGLIWPKCHPDTVTHHFLKTAKAAGVHARLHDLRHTCFTYLVSRGVPLKVVQEIAGHSSITVTQQYAQAYIGDLYNVVAEATGYHKSITPK